MSSPFVLQYLGRIIPLPRGEFRIGRDRSCDLVLEGKLASREHALLRVRDRVVVEDLDSSNGVFVGGERITEPTALSTGELFYIGLHELQIAEKGTSASSAPLPDDPEEVPSSEHSVTTVQAGAAADLHPNDLRALRLFALRCSDDYVAARLGVDEDSVAGIRSRLHRELAVDSEDALVELAQELGLLPQG